MRTVPLIPRTRRTTAARLSPIDMKSVTSTAPSGVSHLLQTTKVLPRYVRMETVASGEAGASFHAPCSSVPRSAPNMDAESKRGRHSQSMDPSRATSAPVWQSPMSA